jgi:transmembrane sensor
VKPDPRLRAALEPVWSEVREQRLLGRIAEARRQKDHARRRRALLLAGGLTVASAAGILLFALHRAERPPGAPAVAAAASTSAASRLTLADGSEATLTADGNVQIEEQSPARVRLRQRTGGARYVVAHNPARDFVVATAGVTIRVRGTIFSVAIRPGAVEIAVERGRVEITDRLRTRDLVAGESLSVSTPGLEPASAAPPAPPALEPAPPALAPQPRAGPLAMPAHGPRPSASELLARADNARADGRPADATRALEEFIAGYPRERRVPATLFTLGRVEKARGRAKEAAAAFERCVQARPDGPLADDALAEAAQSWRVAGVAERARTDARAYLAAHPDGLHAAAMRELARR